MICSGVSLSRNSFDRASARARSAKSRLPPVIPATVAPPVILRKFRRAKQLQSRESPGLWDMCDLPTITMFFEQLVARILFLIGVPRKRSQAGDEANNSR